MNQQKKKEMKGNEHKRKEMNEPKTPMFRNFNREMCAEHFQLRFVGDHTPIGSGE